jgi:hypothetical protein
MTVRTDNCATGFSKIFEERSFLYKNIVQTGWLDSPDGRTSAASNFHNKLRTSEPRGRSIWTAKLQHAISISDACASGWLKSNRQLPYTMHQLPDHSCQMSGRFILNCDSYLTEICVRTVYHIVWTVDLSSLSWNLERISEPFEN